jgi:hypothetical protein
VDFPEGRLKPAWIGKVVKSRAGEELIRSHLVPRTPHDRAYMGAWRTFWRALAFGNRPVVELLTRWQADAEAALAHPDLDDDEAAHLRRFRGDVESTLQRLARAENEPMAWAGAEFSKYQPEQRVMMEALIGAIVLHRGGELSDDELYAILGCMDLDPDDRDNGISALSLAKIAEAARNREPLELESIYRRS